MKMLQAYNIADTCNQIGDLAKLQMTKKASLSIAT